VSPRSVLVTGGAGFIGSHLVDLLLLDPDTRVTVLDRLSTGGSRANLEDHDGDPRFTFV
jgi:nucleoside-diphosphate-sugar epimerase